MTIYFFKLQQYLPFTVLKHTKLVGMDAGQLVATVLTVYGIETILYKALYEINMTLVATVLTVYGIETRQLYYKF